MNEPYYISLNGQHAPINLGINVDPFSRTNSLCSRVWYDGIVGVGWLDRGEQIKFNPSSEKIFAYPTPDMSKMIVIYCDNEIKVPNNAVVLNEDGSRYCQLKAPKRLSTPKGKRLPQGDLTGFMQVGWFDDPKFMKVEFYIAGSDFIETRLLRMSDFGFDETYYKTWRL